MAAMAATPTGQDKLYRNMVWNVEKHCYVVTLYYNGKAETYDVDTVYGDGGHGANWGDPSWTSVYEDALIQYAQVHYRGKGIDWIEGGFGSVAMPVLTGEPATRTTANIDQAAEALDHGQLVTAGSVPEGTDLTDYPKLANGATIVENHEYTVLSVDANDNVTLRNPWGDPNSAGPAVIVLSPGEFYQYFPTISIGSIK
jgi:hypothetical protein